MKWDAIWTIVRDVSFLGVGLGGIIYQQVTGRVSIELLLVYTALLGVPTAMALKQLYPGLGKPETPPTAESSSRSRRSRS